MTRSWGSWVFGGCSLAVAGLQLLWFLPLVEGGRAVDVALWGGGPFLLRVDRLGLLFGVVWAVALAAAATVEEGGGRGWVGLILVGLLGAAYAREPVLFYVGWEVAGTGVWMLAGDIRGKGGRGRLAAMVHGPGLALLGLIAAGGMGAFVPPVGGEGQEWGLGAAVLLGVAAAGRSALPALWSWLNGGVLGRRGIVPAVVGSAGPFLLGKALVEAGWDDWGVWALTLLGSVGLLAVAVAGWKGIGIPMGWVVATAAVVGFGVAPVSPAAAMGAVLLTALGAFLPLMSLADEGAGYSQWVGGVAVAGSAAGMWLIVQGALEAGYGVTGVVVLPVVVLVAMYVGAKRRGEGRRVQRWVVAGVLVSMGVIAVYPQAAVEWFAKPAVEAMAGGVGAPGGVVSEWGLGLAAVGAGESLKGALPATGIAVGVFGAWVALYWMRGAAAWVMKRRSQGSRDDA